jgi:hypothetical protein
MSASGLIWTERLQRTCQRGTLHEFAIFVCVCVIQVVVALEDWCRSVAEHSQVKYVKQHPIRLIPQ